MNARQRRRLQTNWARRKARRKFYATVRDILLMIVIGGWMGGMLVTSVILGLQ